MFDLSAFTERVRDRTNLTSVTKTDTIEFLARPDLEDSLPDPLPANKVLPEWYRNLDLAYDEGLGKRTVKACSPFLDALTMGWIIRLPADIEYRVHESGGVTTNSSATYDVLGAHHPDQLGDYPLPGENIGKLHNMWAIRTPPGYSTLFTKPLNRVELRFQPFSGVVDTDHYANFINFPFMWTPPTTEGVIRRGTPFIQVIPFRRDALLTDASVGTLTREDSREIERESARLGAGEGYYREEVWRSKRGTRTLKSDPGEDADADADADGEGETSI